MWSKFWGGGGGREKNMQGGGGREKNMHIFFLLD